MNAECKTIDVLEQADAEAVLRHALEGDPLDPEVSRRVRKRAERITEEIRRVRGEIPEQTLNQLLRDVRDGQ